MTFVLSSQNVFAYLIEQSLCTKEEQNNSEVEYKYAKNFNLLVSLDNNRKLLVKQERLDREGKTAGEFLSEWRIQEFLQQFPELAQMRLWLSEAIHFNREYSLIVFNYLDNYRDLMDFYTKENMFPMEIGTTLGTIIARIHRLTIDHQNYQDFFSQIKDNPINKIIKKDIGRIDPEIFGAVPSDGLKFFALYQRYDSLGKAIAELGTSLSPCCLTHNDLKLNNILLSNDWEQDKDNNIVRIIDWERCSWGDPAFDLGSLIASYLHLWLISLITSKSISIDESLRMATTPLEQIQPSLAALAIAYIKDFPEILERRPDFWQRVIQFSGLSLIHIIQSTLQYQKSFGNTGICALQVAKSLLCRPEASISTIFGMDVSELIPVRVPSA